jgi:trimeric autotransporter adhesin
MKRGLNKENSLPDPEFGGESSESARAIHYVVQKDTLMTYEKGLFAQADPGIVSGSTIERKQMSTKTIYKRIALVAVTALGAGVLSVAPASAVSAIVTSLPTVGTRVQTVSVGAVAATTVGFTIGANTTTSGGVDTFANTNVTISAKPSASTVSLADRDGAGSTSTAAFSTTGMTTNLNSAIGTADGAFTQSAQSAAAVTAGAVVAGTISIVPDVAGTYTVTVATAGAATIVATIYAYTTATNGATLVGLVADGGLPSNNAAINAVAGVANTVQVRAFPNTTSNIRRLITVSGPGAYISATSGGTVTLAAGTAPTSGTIADNANASVHSDLTIVTPTVGTVTVSIFNESAASSGIFSGTATATVTITVNATAAATTLSVANSSVFASDAAGTAGTAITDAALTPRAGTGAVAFAVRFDVDVKDSLRNAMPNSSTNLTATVAGPGLLNTSNSTSGVTRVITLNWQGSALQAWLFNDGTGGESTVTFSWGSTVLAAKKVSFYGAARTLTAGALKPHITTAASSGQDAIWILARDANNVAVPFTSPVGTSDAPNVVGSAITNCAEASAAEQLLGAPKFSNVCDVAGVSVGTANLTISRGSLTTNAPVIALRVTGSVAATVALSTDKATYAPGEKITLTITARDSAGQLLGAGAYGLLDAANTVSQNLTGTVFAASGADITINAGVATTTYFAPLVAGPFTFSATVDASDADVAVAIQGTTITATASVVERASVDSANIASLTTLVNSLIAKINALNKLVIKIQKKVRA